MAAADHMFQKAGENLSADEATMSN